MEQGGEQSEGRKNDQEEGRAGRRASRGLVTVRVLALFVVVLAIRDCLDSSAGVDMRGIVLNNRGAALYDLALASLLFAASFPALPAPKSKVQDGEYAKKRRESWGKAARWFGFAALVHAADALLFFLLPDFFGAGPLTAFMMLLFAAAIAALALLMSARRWE